MVYDQNTTRILYKKLLALYPRDFKERFAEPMEQTFNDVCNEKRQTQQSFLRFVIWTFVETAIGIVHEHILLIQEIHMKAFLTNIQSSALISVLLILPFMIMEVVNRQSYNEDFPFALFFGLWLNLFAISLTLLPIVLAKRTGKYDRANPVPAHGDILITNPKLALMISVVLILSVVILSVLASLGREPLERLLNGPNSEQLSVFGVRVSSQLIALVLFSLPIAAGIIAGGPIVKTLRAWGQPVCASDQFDHRRLYSIHLCHRVG